MGSESVKPKDREEGAFYCCSLCGKKLIRRLPNGLFQFMFGKMKDENGGLTGESPVVMEIHGSLRMKCIKKKCRDKNPDHWNVFDFLPFKKKPTD